MLGTASKAPSLGEQGEVSNTSTEVVTREPHLTSIWLSPPIHPHNSDATARATAPRPAASLTARPACHPRPAQAANGEATSGRQARAGAVAGGRGVVAGAERHPVAPRDPPRVPAGREAVDAGRVAAQVARRRPSARRSSSSASTPSTPSTCALGLRAARAVLADVPVRPHDAVAGDDERDRVAAPAPSRPPAPPAAARSRAPPRRRGAPRPTGSPSSCAARPARTRSARPGRRPARRRARRASRSTALARARRSGRRSTRRTRPARARRYLELEARGSPARSTAVIPPGPRPRTAARSGPRSPRPGVDQPDLRQHPSGQAVRGRAPAGRAALPPSLVPPCSRSWPVHRATSIVSLRLSARTRPRAAGARRDARPTSPC